MTPEPVDAMTGEIAGQDVYGFGSQQDARVPDTGGALRHGEVGPDGYPRSSSEAF